MIGSGSVQRWHAEPSDPPQWRTERKVDLVSRSEGPRR